MLVVAVRLARVAVVVRRAEPTACPVPSACSSDAMQRIKYARPSVSWLSSAESHKRANAVRPLLRFWLPA